MKTMSLRKKNFLIALLVFILAKVSPYLFSDFPGTSLATFFEIVTVIYLIFGVIAYKLKEEKERKYKYLLVGIAFFVIMIAGNAYIYKTSKDFNTSPGLSIKEPTNEATVAGSSVHVNGIAEKDSLVTINGKPVLVSENGEFGEDIELTKGSNSINVKARNKFNKEITQSISVNASF